MPSGKLCSRRPKNSKTTHYESRAQSNTRADFKSDIQRELWEVMKNIFLGGEGNRLIAREKLIKVLHYRTQSKGIKVTFDRVPWFGRLLKIWVTSSNSGPDWRKRKSEEEERRRGEKSNGCTFCFYNMATLEFLAEKMLLDGKGPFTGNLFINRLEDSVMNSANLSKCTILKWQTTFHANWNQCCSFRALF